MSISCFDYGIGHGCDEECPILQEDKCKHIKEVVNDFYNRGIDITPYLHLII